MRVSWLTIVILLFPASADAAVYFTEIAWMGSVESANHEWIELYNDGAAVNVDGWQIVDENNLNIDLTGAIPTGTRVVLERSSDASAPGSAFLIYTGSLVNSGATLKLLRSDGSLVDQVSGGTDWQNIGGDNETKDTPQYTSSGWKTGVRTPGADFSGQVTSANDDNEEESPDTNSDSITYTSQGSTRSKSTSNSAVELKLPGVTLELAIKAPSVGYVNQPVNFYSRASGIGESLIGSLEYEWNFGTGDVSDRESPEYVFKHPGKYVVTVFASFKRQEQLAKHEITILPITLSLNTNRQGDIVINNESKYEVDLSNYRLQGTKTFSVPPRTFLLPNQSIVIDRSHIVEGGDRLVMIYDAEGVVVDMLPPPKLLALKTESKPTVIDRSPTPMISAINTPQAVVMADSSQRFGFASEAPVMSLGNTVPSTNAAEVEPEESDSAQMASVNQSGTPLGHNWPYLALIGLILLAIFGAIVTKKPEQ